MFVHHVFFWLKPELDEAQRAAFEAGVKSLLTIKIVKIGDAYQADPTHLKFVDECRQYWQRAQIYDSETV